MVSALGPAAAMRLLEMLTRSGLRGIASTLSWELWRRWLVALASLVLVISAQAIFGHHSIVPRGIVLILRELSWLPILILLLLISMLPFPFFGFLLHLALLFFHLLLCLRDISSEHDHEVVADGSLGDRLALQGLDLCRQLSYPLIAMTQLSKRIAAPRVHLAVLLQSYGKLTVL